MATNYFCVILLCTTVICSYIYNPVLANTEKLNTQWNTVFACLWVDIYTFLHCIFCEWATQTISLTLQDFLLAIEPNVFKLLQDNTALFSVDNFILCLVIFIVLVVGNKTLHLFLRKDLIQSSLNALEEPPLGFGSSSLVHKQMLFVRICYLSITRRVTEVPYF